MCQDPYRDFAKRQLYERVAALEGPSRRIPAGPLKGCREETRYSSWLGLIDSRPLSCHKIGRIQKHQVSRLSIELAWGCENCVSLA